MAGLATLPVSPLTHLCSFLDVHSCLQMESVSKRMQVVVRQQVFPSFHTLSDWRVPDKKVLQTIEKGTFQSIVHPKFYNLTDFYVPWNPRDLDLSCGLSQKGLQNFMAATSSKEGCRLPPVICHTDTDFGYFLLTKTKGSFKSATLYFDIPQWLHEVRQKPGYQHPAEVAQEAQFVIDRLEMVVKFPKLPTAFTLASMPDYGPEGDFNEYIMKALECRIDITQVKELHVFFVNSRKAYQRDMVDIFWPDVGRWTGLEKMVLTSKWAATFRLMLQFTDEDPMSLPPSAREIRIESLYESKLDERMKVNASVSMNTWVHCTGSILQAVSVMPKLERLIVPKGHLYDSLRFVKIHDCRRVFEIATNSEACDYSIFHYAMHESAANAAYALKPLANVHNIENLSFNFSHVPIAVLKEIMTANTKLQSLVLVNCTGINEGLFTAIAKAGLRSLTHLMYFNHEGLSGQCTYTQQPVVYVDDAGERAEMIQNDDALCVSKIAENATPLIAGRILQYVKWRARQITQGHKLSAVDVVIDPYKEALLIQLVSVSPDLGLERFEELKRAAHVSLRSKISLSVAPVFYPLPPYNPHRNVAAAADY